MFHNVRNYGPDIQWICRIMGLKSYRIYRNIGTNLSYKMARLCQLVGRAIETFTRFIGCGIKTVRLTFRN